MSKFGNFSYKKFCVMLVLSCCTIFVDAQAEETSTQTSCETKTLCSKGYYLSRCGNKSLGTEWLKGLVYTTETDTTGRANDYFSHGKPLSDMIHMDNLRKFFAGTEPFNYYPDENDSTVYNTVTPNVYVAARDVMLETVCTSANGPLNSIECEKCPGNALVEESTVCQQSANNQYAYTNWKVHTIADCYMQEFSDNTGTYKYVQNPTETSYTGQHCYYSVNVSGDKLWETSTSDSSNSN